MEREAAVTIYRRHLPHWRQPEATYFVTFRLADSLPQTMLKTLKRLRNERVRKNALPRSRADRETFWQQHFLESDHYLDQGAGSCVLKDPRVRKHVVLTMLHFNEQSFELGCFVVMPNHVHALVRPHNHSTMSLARMTHSWKRHSARRVNQDLGTTGQLWQHESYDRIIRDEEHLWRTVQYVGRNPHQAGLDSHQFTLWLSPHWKRAGWNFVANDLYSV